MGLLLRDGKGKEEGRAREREGRGLEGPPFRVGIAPPPKG